ncbi:hypothetical protein EXE58_06760 [Nocardioides seonyuensis]|uniref:Uncharacterized protein n=1 Tax=Nocardioides seonyuensis TaxID=2518371 RepID=A0A4P7IF46_9ACTN|nr:hypothetical protein [Nocardioides seonyuensis]QBX55183.1 hypothetical protein EXE58_06760 [Nocardioides seonyuensis]
MGALIDRRLGALVATEARLMLTRSRARAGAALIGLAAVAVALTPVGLFGDPETVGAGGWWLGLQLGCATGCVLGPTTVLVSTGLDFDRGTRRARHLAGTDVASLSVAQTLAAVGVVMLTSILIGAATTLAGLADQAARALLGPPASVVATESAAETVPLLLICAVGATLVAALLVHAAGSGKRAALVIIAAIGSYALPLTMLIDRPPWLALLPAASLWQAISPVAQPVHAPTSWFIGASIGWALLLVPLGVRGIRRA